LSISRKQFVTAAALGVSSVALDSGSTMASAEPAALHFHVLLPNEYDRAQMLATIRVNKPSKQTFQSVSPIAIGGVASLYLHMQNSLNAYEFSYGLGPGTLATLGVLTGPSIVYALNDAMWVKYGFGAALKLAPTNVYYAAKSLRENGSPDDPTSIYQDWSAQAVLRRGGAFMVCHNAMTAVAGLFAQKSGGSSQNVLDDFTKNVLPGFQIVPAGVAATQLALENGWHPYPVI
jgi:intracellular sulfur oxidation DsrE/DsrF family protein